jgi:hypothetical protein
VFAVRTVMSEGTNGIAVPFKACGDRGLVAERLETAVGLKADASGFKTRFYIGPEF